MILRSPAVSLRKIVADSILRATGVVSRRQFLEAAGVTVAGSLAVAACGCSPFSKPARTTTPTSARFVTRPDLRPPLITTSRTGPIGSGLIFLTASGPLIVDNQGSPSWYLPTPSGVSVADFKLQQYQGQPVLVWWQGKVSNPGFGKGEHVVMDQQYRQLRTIQAGNGYQADLHDLQLTPQGTALMTVFNPVTADLSAIGGSVNGQLLDCIVQEVDLASGRVLFEWHARDHVDLVESEVAVPKSGSKVFDYFHLNSIEVAPDGNLLISARNTWALYKLDRRSGAVLWRLSGKRSDFPMTAARRFAFQHDARWHEPDGITLFDDGAGPPNVESRSRGIRLAINETTKSVSLAAEFPHSPNVLATSQGNIQLLDSGGLFIGWGSQPYFSEHLSSGEQVFAGRLAVNQSYRAFRFPWTGRPSTQPAVAARRNGAGLDVFASWSGATEVTHWQLQAGRSAATMAKLATAERSGFETKISVATGGPFLSVTALDASGAALGVSPTVRF